MPAMLVVIKQKSKKNYMIVEKIARIIKRNISNTIINNIIHVIDPKKYERKLNLYTL